MTHLIIFDLDGTLADTRADIAHAVNLTRRQYGRSSLPLEEIISYVGDGSRRLIERSFHDASDQNIEETVNAYLQWYTRFLVVYTRLYPGVKKGLETFDRRGIKMAILSNKPGNLCRMFVDHFNLGKYFSAIIGGGDLPELKPDPSGIVHIINDQKNLGFDPKQVWMVGDTHTDLNAAAGAGVNSVYCRFGFGDHGGVYRDFEISSFLDLVEIFSE